MGIVEDETREEVNAVNAVSLETHFKSSEPVLATVSHIPDADAENEGPRVDFSRFSIEDNGHVTVSPRLQKMREFACHLSFFLAGYK